METAQEFQDVYSSTSSDDQSSINSVVHVGAATEESESDLSAPPTPKRVRQNGEAGRSLDQQDDSTSDESELDEEALIRAEEERQMDEDSSSTSSEETQIWVPPHRPGQNRPQAAPKPNVPPKPVYRNSIGNSASSSRNSMGNSSSSGGLQPRTSMISQNSSTGKVEVVLVNEETPNNGDSGISNESPGDHHGDGDRESGHFNPPSSSASSIHHGNHHNPHHNHGNLNSPRSHSSSARSSQCSGVGLHAHMNAIQYHASSPSHPSNHNPHVVTLPTIPSPAPSPVQPHTVLRMGENSLLTGGPDSEQMKAQVRESLFNILSGLYAMVLVVTGASLPIAEIFGHNIPSGVFEGFYIYLYLVSVMFLTYVYLFLLRSRAMPRSKRRSSKAEDNALITKSPARRKKVTVGPQGHTGSFYLRLGAVGFGIGAMIHEGLMFGQVFETKLTLECVDVAQIIRPIIHLAFTFIQLYFIFLNSKMCIHRYRIFARFGLMHMIATNLCVWLRVIVMETIREIKEHNQHSHSNHSSHDQSHVRSHDKSHGHVVMPSVTPTPNHHLSFVDVAETSGEYPVYVEINHTGALANLPHVPPDCAAEEIISKVVEASSPYLYPCTIEYSLIAAGILYIMWRNIGLSSPPQTPDEVITADELKKKQHRMSVDCSNANRGLFFGIFTLVGTIISMIVFFVLVDKPQFSETAVMVVHISELVLYFLAMVALVIAAWRIKDMNFHIHRDNSLDEILLLSSMTGVLLFCVFSIVAGNYADRSTSSGGTLIMSSSFLILLEAILQTVFILNGLRRSSKYPYHEAKKPGRECITFLLVCNVAMWGINTFEVMRADSNPVAMEFYGFLPWSIITHISTPLAIFYRFHSTVCLSSIWKDAYKLNKTD